MSTFIEYDHPVEGRQAIEVRAPDEVAFDKVTSLLECIDPNEPRKSFTAYFYVDSLDHIEQHEHFMRELDLDGADMLRAPFDEYEDILDLYGYKLARQVQAHPNGRIFGVMYVAGELRDIEMRRQQQAKGLQDSLGSISLRS